MRSKMMKAISALAFAFCVACAGFTGSAMAAASATAQAAAPKAATDAGSGAASPAVAAKPPQSSSHAAQGGERATGTAGEPGDARTRHRLHPTDG